MRCPRGVWPGAFQGGAVARRGLAVAVRMDVYYPWYMSLRRTNVYADADDLMLIKEAAARRGIPEAEIIREGIHLAAMSSRVWDEPLDWPTFEGTGQPARGDEVTRAVARGAAES